MKKMIVGLVMLVMITGCGIFSQYANLSSLDKAIVTASQLSAWYTTTHKSVTDLYAISTPDKQLWLRENVNPKMNQVKLLIVDYVDTVNVWKTTGAEPLNLPTVVDKINTLCSDILISIGGV